MLSEFAPAKVNLALHVLGRRADGYHLIDSLVVFAGVGDRLLAEPAGTLSLAFEGPFAGALAGEKDNLVLRAARLLADAARVRPGARLVLEKNLPVASGIGGGSADAAAALRLLARLWRVEVPHAEMLRLALELGADVPACLGGLPARMQGVGEVLTPAPALPSCGIALVNPGAGVRTSAVFGARSGAFSAPLALPSRWADAAAMAADLAGAGNDLQAPALTLEPAIGAALAALRAAPDCLLARMSGSGATCFGLFATAAQSEAAAQHLRRPGWWSWGGGLAGVAAAPGAT